MKVLIDGDGLLRCARCGANAFDERRGVGHSLLVGLEILFTPAALYCRACGTRNEPGIPIPIDDPGSPFYSGRSASKRLCPSCGDVIARSDGECRECGATFEAWRFKDGYWWARNEDGAVFWFDARRNAWVELAG